MNHQQTRPSGKRKPARARSEDGRLRLVQVAGGDAAFLAKLREMLWQSYAEANWPFGPSEDGMFAWWAHQRDAAGL